MQDEKTVKKLKSVKKSWVKLHFFDCCCVRPHTNLFQQTHRLSLIVGQLKKLLFRSTCTSYRVASCCSWAAAALSLVVVVRAGLEGSQFWSDDVSVLQEQVARNKSTHTYLLLDSRRHLRYLYCTFSLLQNDQPLNSSINNSTTLQNLDFLTLIWVKELNHYFYTSIFS